MDVVVALAPEPLVWLYFSTLGYAATRTFGGAARGWPRPVALVSIAVTWFLIVRWMVEYKREGGNEILVQAYVDVLRTSHYAVSAQLLTWVAVAIVWAHEAPLHVILFGMLGAMSAAFACWIACAIPFFMVVQSDLGRHGQPGRVAQATVTVDCVIVHLAAFIRIERTGFAQHGS